jgi:hypothetical protein
MAQQQSQSKYPPPEEHFEHPFQSHADRYLDDIRLRRHGYTIAARPAGGIALWFAPGGTRIVTQPQALSEIGHKRRVEICEGK